MSSGPLNLMIKTFEIMKTGEKYRDLVLDEAIHNLRKTEEALEDPEQWYKDSEFSAKTFLKAFPFIYFAQQELLSCNNSSP
jgi:hypothetical protein